MPVLINTETGLAENLPEVSAEVALATGTHQIPLNDPNGSPVIAPKDQAPHLLTQGYTQPSDDQHQQLLDFAQYSQPSEQAKTALEGAASAASFGLSTKAETALGVDPEAIRKRREINPGVQALGQVAGLAATAPLGAFGAMGAVGRAGEMAAAGIGLPVGEALVNAGAIAKIGSAAVRGAVETALLTSGDEASKVFSGDPDASAGNIAIAAGLGGILGGGIGAVSPLWEATGGTRLGQTLSELKDRANGLIRNAPSESLEQAIEKSGLEVPGEIKAVMGKNPDLQYMFQQLQESRTSSGMSAQESLAKFKSDASQKLMETLGRTREGVADLSEAEAGNALKLTMERELRAQVDPLAQEFATIKERFRETPFSEASQADLSNELGNIQQQFAVSPSSPEYQKLSKVMEELTNVRTLEDLRNLQTVHLNDIANKQLWSISTPVKNAMRNAEEEVVMRSLSAEAPDLIPAHMAARERYRSVMSMIDDLNERVHVGKYSGPDSFIRALSDMTPEDVLRRLTPKSDAQIVQLLQQRLPATAEAVKSHYLDQLAKIASTRASPNEALNAKSLFNALDKWSPELKQFALNPEAAERIGAIKGMLEAIPQSMNPPHTARTLDALWSKVPAGAMGIVSLLTGHNPIAGLVLGHLGKAVARDIPDAVRLATLKYLGEGKPVSVKGFKAAVSVAEAIISGESKLNKASKALFKSGVDVLPPKLMPGEPVRRKLDRKLDQLRADATPLLNVGGESGYYLPDHASALGAVSARALSYLSSLKPEPTKAGPLDPELKPSQAEMAVYDRALDIAEQPLMALQAIKDGTLTEADVNTLKTVYPGLYSHMANKLSADMIDHVSDGETIPYATRLNLSLFLGEPLDSSMTPQSIAQSQAASIPPPQEQNVARGTSGDMKSLQKLPSSYQTSSQSRVAQRQQRA